MRNNRSILVASFIVLMAAMTAFLGGAVRPAEAADAPIGATLIGSYETTYTTGPFGVQIPTVKVSSGYQVRADIADLRAAGFNDKAIAVHVTIGTAVAVYADINYLGTCETLFGTHRIDLNNSMVGANAISSVRLNATCDGPTTGKPVITDLSVVNGSSAGLRCPDRFSRINQNLNQSVGGDYIYICVRYGPSNVSAGIRNVRVIGPFSGATCCDADLAPVSLSCQDPDVLAQIDLNKGVSGYGYVYLCVSRFPLRSGSAYTPLREITAFSINHTLSLTEIDSYCQSNLNVPADSVDGEITDLNEPMFSTSRPPLNIYLCKSTYGGGNAATPAGDVTPPAISVTAQNMPLGCSVYCVPTNVASGSVVTTPGTVTVRWACSESAPATPAENVTRNGIWYFTGTCTDAWGNQSTKDLYFQRSVP